MADYLIKATGNLTIKNGTINSSGRGIYVSDAKLDLENVKMNCVERCVGAYNNADVTIDKDCVLTTYNEACQSEDDTDVTIMVYADANRTDANTKVDIFGKVINNDAFQGGWAISGNGTKNRGVNTITIEEGAEVTALSESAIYHPQGGTITINGKVEGKDGIYMKSGNLIVEETAVINGNGAGDSVYEYSGDGTKSPLGHGIVMEFTNYPGGITNLTMNGGTVTAAEKDAIGYYVSPKCEIQDLDTLKSEHIVING